MPEAAPSTRVRAVLRALKSARELAILKELRFVTLEMEEVESLEIDLTAALSDMK